MASGEGGGIAGEQSPLMPRGWGRRCDDRKFTVLRRLDADGEDESGLLGRDKTVGDAVTRELCALHLPKRTWVAKFDGKPIAYFYIDKEWDSSHRCYPLCTCMDGDIVVPSDAFDGYTSASTAKSNQINCWRFYSLAEDSSVKDILKGGDYPVYLRQQLTRIQQERGFSDDDLNRYMSEFVQFISADGAGDSESRIVNVDFSYGTTVMIDKNGNGSWLADGPISLYGIFAPAFFEDYKIYPFDEERANTWVSADGKRFCVGLRNRGYYASAQSPQEYVTVRTSFGEFDNERPVTFYPLGSTFGTYEAETVRGGHGWEIRYTNYPAGQGVLRMSFKVPVAGNYTSGIGFMQNGQFFYNDYFDVRELDEHSGLFARTDYMTARFGVEYDVQTLEIERIEGIPFEDEDDVTQEWFSSGSRYLGTETSTTTYPQDLESHITFERL